MTVHKSQSLTLDKVVVDLDKAFADGESTLTVRSNFNYFPRTSLRGPFSSKDVRGT
jgi:hypothetical protein